MTIGKLTLVYKPTFFIGLIMTCLLALGSLDACSAETKAAIKQGTKFANAKLTGEASLRQDLERWCTVFTEMEKKSFEDDGEKSLQFLSQSEKALRTPEGMKLLQLMAASEPDQKWLDQMTLKEAKSYMAEGHFAPGSMAPKMAAIIRFLEQGGKQALVTDPENITRALNGETGTWIFP